MDRDAALPVGLLMRALFNRPACPERENCLYFGYGRRALVEGLAALGVVRGDRILVPDYICDVVYSSFQKVGVVPELYGVDDSFEPDWDTLRVAARHGAKVAMSVNYFGFPQALERWRELCSELGIRWIEDNAHGFGSRFKGRLLGSWGDVGITSMRKTLPLLNGAVLNLNTVESVSRALAVAQSGLLSWTNAERKVLLKNALRWLGFSIRRLKGATFYDNFPPPGEGESSYSEAEFDVISLSIMKALEPRMQEFAATRRQLYRAWEKFCAEAGLIPVFRNCPDDVAPMVFPCYARSLEERQNWLRWGWDRRIDIYPWPSLPRLSIDRAPRAAARWQRLLCFPINPGIRPDSVLALRP